ncbi:MAG: Hint domain-containing protein [Paracoccaceae bacterium]|nr:Hint domain-containing protein [Paracoccaceae bacterium]
MSDIRKGKGFDPADPAIIANIQGDDDHNTGNSYDLPPSKEHDSDHEFDKELKVEDDHRHDDKDDDKDHDESDHPATAHIAGDADDTQQDMPADAPGDNGGDNGASTDESTGGDMSTGGEAGTGTTGSGETCATGTNDTIVGTAGNDALFGGAGNDTITGRAGDDLIHGGAGNDDIRGNAGDDILFGDGANSQAEVVNLIQNGSFEDVSGLDPTTYGYVGNGSVPGWTTADPAHQIDIHGDARGGVQPADGHYWADLEATPGNIVLGQDVQGVADGEKYLLTFSAGDRITDTNTFEVIWNGEPVDIKGQEIIDPVNGAMQQYNVVLTGGSGDGSNRIEFKGLGDANRRGVSIDNVKMVPVDHGDCDGDDTISGGGGDDLIFAGDGADTVYGGHGDDIIYGDDNDTPTQNNNGSGGGSSDHDHSDGSGPKKAHARDHSHNDPQGQQDQANAADHHAGHSSAHSGSGQHDADNGSGPSGHTGHDGNGSGNDSGSGNGSGGGSGNGSGDGDGNGPDACNLTHGVGPNGDTIHGGAGADTIFGMAGHDYLSGGQGDDTILGGSGNDHILGNQGDDHLEGGDGNDCIEGGVGNDTIFTGEGADMVSAGADRDVIHGSSGDHIDGGAGGDDFDTLVVSDVDHIVYTSDDMEDGIVHFNDGGTLEFEEIEKIVPCFTPGTMILTAAGERPVETLKIGDRVVTRDNGLQEIRWIGTKPLSGQLLAAAPHLRPILIRRGTLGNGLPERDLMVSPNHRILIANDKTSLFFEEPEVLVAAKHLVNGCGIQQVDSVGLSYIHMMFDHHEVILGDGAWSESFQPGDYSLRGIGDEQRAEIFELFPELRKTRGQIGYAAARRSLKRKEAELLF